MAVPLEKNARMKDRKVTVIGAARSGVAAARLLGELGAKVFLSDRDPDAKKNEEVAELQKHGVEFEFGVHSNRTLETDLMLVSPGVPQNSEPVVTAIGKGIPVISEVELACWYTELPIVAVTGTNGKTTTATVLANMVREGGYVPFLAGNVGIPFTETVYKILGKEPKNGIHVLEISSFQMEHIHLFRPKIAVLLNLSPDHLNRYPSMGNYVSAKMRIMENMTADDHVVYNHDDPSLRQQIDTSAPLTPFSLEIHPQLLFHVNETKVYDESREVLVHLKDLLVPGKHNLANFLAAATAGKLLDVPTGAITKVLRTFRGVPHRLEHVRTLEGVDYYNDSKATNVQSVRTGIDSFTRPIILIMGGRDKGADFKELLPQLTSHVKQVLVLGEAADRIKETLSHVVPCNKVPTVDTAVSLAHENAEQEDVVLLSPGCASFDMFSDFEERGEVFKTAVNRLGSRK